MRARTALTCLAAAAALTTTAARETDECEAKRNTCCNLKKNKCWANPEKWECSSAMVCSGCFGIMSVPADLETATICPATAVVRSTIAVAQGTRATQPMDLPAVGIKERCEEASTGSRCQDLEYCYRGIAGPYDATKEGCESQLSWTGDGDVHSSNGVTYYKAQECIGYCMNKKCNGEIVYPDKASMCQVHAECMTAGDPDCDDWLKLSADKTYEAPECIDYCKTQTQSLLNLAESVGSSESTATAAGPAAALVAAAAAAAQALV